MMKQIQRRKKKQNSVKFLLKYMQRKRNKRERGVGGEIQKKTGQSGKP